MTMARSKNRELLIKMARDSIVERASKLYLAEYRDQLEFLKPGDPVPLGAPVGKDHFVEWVEYIFNNYFPEVSGVVENEKVIKEYAVQIADNIAKSDTNVQNPLRDYELNKEPSFIKADQIYSFTKQSSSFAPSGSIKDQTQYVAPTTHSRYCPEHPGAPLQRLEDNKYRCPITKDLDSTETWKNSWNYKDGHIVEFDSGVQNQINAGWNEQHPLPGLFSTHPAVDYRAKPNQHYDTATIESPRQSLKNANKLLSFVRQNKSSVTAQSQQKRANQLFAPTTMSSRQCPDHPGQQLRRVTDNIRECPLDYKQYDFERGFTTDDGKRHNGGSVAAQNSFPPNLRLLTSSVKRAQISADTRQVHEFLYELLQYLPSSAEYQRKVLNYKFQKNVSLEEAISAIKQAAELATQPQAQQQLQQQAKLSRRLIAQSNPYMSWPLAKLEKYIDKLEEIEDSGGGLTLEEQHILALMNEAADIKADIHNKAEEEVKERERARALAKEQEEQEQLRLREIERAEREEARERERIEEAARTYDNISRNRMKYPEWYSRVIRHYPIRKGIDGSWIVQSIARDWSIDQSWTFKSEKEAKQKVVQLIKYREYEQYHRDGTGIIQKPPRNVDED